MSNSLSPAELRILATLQAGHALTVRWDCGGDERFVYTAVDGQETDDPDPDGLPELLDEYLCEALDLPDAGDFSMRGTGRIFQQGQEVVIDYQSESWADDSWMQELSDEELTEIGVARPAPADEEAGREEPDYTPDDDYSGHRVLFTLP